MPSTYAHYRFGKQVRALLSEDIRCIIDRQRALYDIGLQGPDILFHYNAFSHNPVNQLGHAMHDWSGHRFFGAIEGKATSDAAKAYLWGLICHFSLDSVCHGTVNRTVEETGIGHFDVETEYERALMLNDGLDPFRYKPAAHFAPNETLGQVMADFFGITAKQALKAVRAMKSDINLLVARNPVWRCIVETVLKAAGQKDLYGLVIKRKVDAALIASTERLVQLGAQAENVALRLILAQKEGTLLEDMQMDLDFSSRKVCSEESNK